MCAAAAQPQLANQSGLARILGVSRQAINDLVKRNVLSARPDGMIDVQLARVAIASRVHPRGKTVASSGDAITVPAPPPPPASAGAPQAADGELSYHVAKTLREGAEAKRAQLRLKEELGQALDADSTLRAVAAIQLAARNEILTLADRLAPIVATETDLRKVHQLIHAEAERACETISTRLAALSTAVVVAP